MKINIPKRYLFYVLAFSSAIITAIVSGIDAIAQLHIPDPWALGIACFVFGIIISTGFAIVFSIPYKGKSLGAHTIDPTFHRIRLIKKEEIPYNNMFGADIFWVPKILSGKKVKVIVVYDNDYHVLDQTHDTVEKL